MSQPFHFASIKPCSRFTTFYQYYRSYLVRRSCSEFIWQVVVKVIDSRRIKIVVDDDDLSVQRMGVSALSHFGEGYVLVQIVVEDDGHTAEIYVDSSHE